MYENIELEHSNYCYVDGLYYYISIEYGSLFAKSVGGKVVFTYPISKYVATDPLKLEFDGVYFYSLHLEYSRDIIRKWRIDNYTLKYIYEYDYSSIGVLAEKTLEFNKYFSDDVTADGWVESSVVSSDAHYGIIDNNLVVADYGHTTTQYWQGPRITRHVNNVFDFYFKFKYHLGTGINYYNRISVQFVDDVGNLKYELLISHDKCWLKEKNAYTYDNGTNNSKYDEYDFLELKRYNTKIYLSINTKVLFIGSTFDDHFNSVRVSIYRYSIYKPVNYFKIYSLDLYSFTNQYRVATSTLVIDKYTNTFKEYTPKASNQLILASTDPEIPPGTTLYLGDPYGTTYEEVTVTGTISPGILGINFFTYFEHSEGEKVNFAKNIYLFNNYQRSSPGGSIYKINITNGLVVDTFDSDNYSNILSGCFYTYKSKYLIGYVYGTNLISLEITDTLLLDDVMNMENVKTDQATVIPIVDIEVHDEAIYRLQKSANYYGVDYSWSTYNTQVTPVNSYIDSTLISAYPKLINSDGISVVDIKVVVKDQYASPQQFLKVHVTDDDNVGYITIPVTYTDLVGKAISYYKAGITPREVKLSVEGVQEN